MVAALSACLKAYVGGGTLPKANPMKTYLNFRNNLTMLYKNLPDNELGRVMRMRWLLDYVAAAKLLLIDHNWQECKAVIRGRRAFYRWRHDFDNDRRRIAKTRRTDKVPERVNYSILWQYYVKGHKHFSDL